MFKKFIWNWKKFWGYRYRVFKDDKVVEELLIYKRRIYILEQKDTKL